jgi:hypothetical protein
LSSHGFPPIDRSPDRKVIVELFVEAEATAINVEARTAISNPSSSLHRRFAWP